MKTRTIVGLAAVPLFILAVFFAPLWAFSILVGLISAGSAWELLRCVEEKMPLRFRIYATALGFALPVVYALVGNGAVVTTAIYVITVLMFAELMLSFRNKEHIKLETVLYVIFAGGIMPLLLASFVQIGLREDNSSAYLFLPIVAAFSSDSGGYFAGYFWGNRKAFPHLSPKKTIAGCIGGAVAAILLMLAYGLVLMQFSLTVSYPLLALYGLFGSIACQFGDLAFSAVKRQYGTKDYGNLIPGHGGMLDRFDSMHFTAPMIALLVVLAPAIK